MSPVQQFTRAAVLVAACTVASAGAHAQTSAQQKPGGTQSGAKATASQTAVSADDTTFAQKAAEGGMKEVQAAKMAASKASNAQVKAYASKLLRDHTTSNNQLMAIAKRKRIDLPTPASMSGKTGSVGARNDATADTKTGGGQPAGGHPTGTTGASGGVQTTGHAMANEPWMSETGAAFDKGFIDAQVNDHQEHIAMFEKQSSGGSDAQLKAFAAKQLPILRAHLKQAQDLQSKLGGTTR